MKLHLHSQTHQGKHFGNASPLQLPPSFQTGCSVPGSLLPRSPQWFCSLVQGADQKVSHDTVPQHAGPSPPMWFMLTGIVMCLTWWCPTWGEEGISAVPNKSSGSPVTPACQAEPAEGKVISSLTNILGCLQQKELLLLSYYPDYYFYLFSFFFTP